MPFWIHMHTDHVLSPWCIYDNVLYKPTQCHSRFVAHVYTTSMSCNWHQFVSVSTVILGNSNEHLLGKSFAILLEQEISIVWEYMEIPTQSECQHRFLPFGSFVVSFCILNFRMPCSPFHPSGSFSIWMNSRRLPSTLLASARKSRRLWCKIVDAPRIIKTQRSVMYWMHPAWEDGNRLLRTCSTVGSTKARRRTFTRG